MGPISVFVCEIDPLWCFEEYFLDCEVFCLYVGEYMIGHSLTCICTGTYIVYRINRNEKFPKDLKSKRGIHRSCYTLHRKSYS